MVIKKEEILGEYSLPIFLLRCRTDFKFFAERCLGLTSYGGIHDFQLKWVDAAERYNRLIIESGAGSSKTEIMGVAYPLWKMFCYSNLKILLVCKTINQSTSNMLSRIQNYIKDNELLTEIFIPKGSNYSWNMEEIKTTNGHWVKVVPYNKNIKSYRADYILADEIDSYEDYNIFFEDVLSRLYPQAKLIGFSTPTGHLNLIGQIKEKYAAGLLKGKWFFLKTPFLVDRHGEPAVINNQEDILNYKSIWEEWWNTQIFYERYGEQGRANWMRNYMCENIGEVDAAYFPIEGILKSYDYNLGFSNVIDEEAFCVISADFAQSDGPRADLDAYIVTERKNIGGKLGYTITIKTMEKYKGLDTIFKIKRLKELYELYKRDKGIIIVVDPSNVGIDVMNGLLAEGLPVVKSTFQSEARKKLYKTLSNVLSSGRVIIPRCVAAEDDSIRYSQELQNQLAGFRMVRNDRGNEQLESRAPHDDWAASLAMNVNEIIQHEEMDLLPLSG